MEEEEGGGRGWRNRRRRRRSRRRKRRPIRFTRRRRGKKSLPHQLVKIEDESTSSKIKLKKINHHQSSMIIRHGLRTFTIVNGNNRTHTQKKRPMPVIETGNLSKPIRVNHTTRGHQLANERKFFDFFNDFFEV